MKKNKNAFFVKSHMLLFVCLSVILSASFSCTPKYDVDTVVENVNVIDVESGTILKNVDVLITHDKITKMIPHGSVQVHSGKIIDGSFKYLIPGLWDMHEHLLNENWYETQMPLLRANGITGFREMFGSLKTADTVKVQMEKGMLPFFRFVASGHIIDGKKPFWERSVSIAQTNRVNHIVDSLIENKADFIKVYSLLRPEVFFAIAKRCNEKMIPFAGHVPYSVGVEEASGAKMASMEHLYGFLTEACTQRDSAMALMNKLLTAIEEGNLAKRKELSLQWNSLVINNFSKERMKVIAQTLKRNNTHIVPTLVTLRGKYFSNDTSFTNDERLKYMSAETLKFWSEFTAGQLANNTQAEWLNYRKRWALEREIMQILISEQVPVMAGTDADNPYAFPGFSLHDEMAMYVELGMQPIDALRSSTIVPARYLKLSDFIGSVQEGKLADMVLLNANPLENIRNTSKVHSVFVDGRFYGKKYIDSVLMK